MTAPVPGVAPGTYYVILRTDVLDQFPEATTANNLSASLTQRSIDAAGPDPGQCRRRHAGQGTVGLLQGRRDRRPDIADRASTARTAASLNELYVSFGTMPTLGQFDYRYTRWRPNQQITVPTTQAGTYYILAYGSAVRYHARELLRSRRGCPVRRPVGRALRRSARAR